MLLTLFMHVRVAEHMVIPVLLCMCPSIVCVCAQPVCSTQLIFSYKAEACNRAGDGATFSNSTQNSLKVPQQPGHAEAANCTPHKTHTHFAVY